MNLLEQIGGHGWLNAVLAYLFNIGAEQMLLLDRGPAIGPYRADIRMKVPGLGTLALVRAELPQVALARGAMALEQADEQIEPAFLAFRAPRAGVTLSFSAPGATSTLHLDPGATTYPIFFGLTALEEVARRAVQMKTPGSGFFALVDSRAINEVGLDTAATLLEEDGLQFHYQADQSQEVGMHDPHLVHVFRPRSA